MRTIRGKILATVLAVSLLSLCVLAAVCMVNLQGLQRSVIAMSDELGNTAGEDSQKAMESQILTQLTQIAEAKASVADEKLGKQQTYVQMMSSYLSSFYAAPEKYAPMEVLPPDPSLAGTLSAQLILSAAAAADPTGVADELGLVGNAADIFLTIPTHDPDIESNYYCTLSGINVLIDDVSDKKGPTLEGTERGWFKSAVAADHLIWSDVYDDSMGRGLAITCAAPFYDRRVDEMKGVVGFGSLITTMSDDIINTKIGETGYAFVVNDQGQTIISPNIRKDEKGNIIRESLLSESAPELVAIAEKMLDGGSGVSRVFFQGREVYLAYQPMEVLPWTVVTVMDVEEALAPATAARENIVALTNGTVQNVDAAIKGVIIALIIVFLAAILVVSAASALLAQRITRPLTHLIEGVRSISGGDLETQLDLRTGDEIEHLATAFNTMTKNLKHYIRDLTAITAEKERIGAELGVATHIQASMLPCIFPAFPDRAEFDIYATMQPAKEVGGDFYDFFLVDDDHLAVVIADVSGKGVPAALFMVIAKTLIKDHTQAGNAPEEVFTEVNDQLCQSNDEGLFVTAWMGVLQISTGHMVFVNAGHNPPLVRHDEGKFEFLALRPGFVLAGMDGLRYKAGELDLAPGDTLYLYTDGVTEATDAHEALYGEPRLKAVLDEHQDAIPEHLLPAVQADIDVFVGDADQFDDITMLALHVNKEGDTK